MKTSIIVPKQYTEHADIYTAGFNRGFNVASWQDTPEIGSTLPRHIDWQGIGRIEDANDQADAIQLLASEAESNDRDYSPFEFTAKELNDREDSEDAWQAFDAGINDGILAEIAARNLAS